MLAKPSSQNGNAFNTQVLVSAQNAAAGLVSGALNLQHHYGGLILLPSYLRGLAGHKDPSCSIFPSQEEGDTSASAKGRGTFFASEHPHSVYLQVSQLDSNGFVDAAQFISLISGIFITFWAILTKIQFSLPTHAYCCSLIEHIN